MKRKNFLAVALVLVFVLVMAVMPAYAAKPSVEGAYLEDFERAEFNGGTQLSDGTQVYWNQAGSNSLVINDGVLHAVMQTGGFIRWATNNDKEWKYVIIRVKGNENAANDKIYTRMGAAEKGLIDDGSTAEKALNKLVGPDGGALPAITGEYQEIVIDLAKSGLALGGGSNAFQLGTWQAMELDIDYIFATNTLPAAPKAEETKTDAKTETTTTVANPKTGDTTPIAPVVAVVVIAAAALVVLSRKKVNA